MARLVRFRETSHLYTIEWQPSPGGAALTVL